LNNLDNIFERDSAAELELMKTKFTPQLRKIFYKLTKNLDKESCFGVIENIQYRLSTSKNAEEPTFNTIKKYMVEFATSHWRGAAHNNEDIITPFTKIYSQFKSAVKTSVEKDRVASLVKERSAFFSTSMAAEASPKAYKEYRSEKHYSTPITLKKNGMERFLARIENSQLCKDYYRSNIEDCKHELGAKLIDNKKLERAFVDRITTFAHKNKNRKNLEYYLVSAYFTGVKNSAYNDFTENEKKVLHGMVEAFLVPAFREESLWESGSPKLQLRKRKAIGTATERTDLTDVKPRIEPHKNFYDKNVGKYASIFFMRSADTEIMSEHYDDIMREMAKKLRCMPKDKITKEAIEDHLWEVDSEMMVNLLLKGRGRGFSAQINKHNMLTLKNGLSIKTASNYREEIEVARELAGVYLKQAIEKPAIMQDIFRIDEFLAR